MEQFNLEKYLENPSRKVVTRRGNSVRIICADRKHGKDNLTVVFLEESPDGIGEFLLSCRSNGKFDTYDTPYDLFFADEEKTNKILDELKSYLKNTPKEQVEKDWKEIQDWYNHNFTNEKHNKEEGLTEFEKLMIQFSHERNSLIQFEHSTEEINAHLHRYSEKLLDWARKEILKDLPKWKKCVGSTGPFIDDFRGEDYLYLRDYVIKVSELFEKLPKEE